MTEVLLFGDSPPPSRCAHQNASYTLETTGRVTVRSRRTDRTNAVEETGRKTTWSGGVSFRCEECGKSERYTGSQIPRFVADRLLLWDGIDGVEGRPYAERGKGRKA